MTFKDPYPYLDKKISCVPFLDNKFILFTFTLLLLREHLYPFTLKMGAGVIIYMRKTCISNAEEHRGSLWFRCSKDKKVQLTEDGRHTIVLMCKQKSSVKALRCSLVA